MTTYPDADKLIVKYDPREQIYAAHVDSEQGQGVGSYEYAERVNVQVVGEHPQHAEHGAASQEVGGRKPAVSEVAHALAQDVSGRLVVEAAQLTKKVQREEQHGPIGAKPCSEEWCVIGH